MDQINQLLKTQNSPGSVSLKLYQLNKKLTTKFSLQYICNKSGISSKGYLSDFMKGKKKLKPEYAKGLAKTFGLNKEQTRVFTLLVKLDRTPDPQQQKKLTEQILSARKSLDLKRSALKQGDFDPFILSKVFCSFGLFESPPNAKRISKTIKENLHDTQLALNELLKQKLISEQKDTFKLNQNQQIKFTQGDQKEFHKVLIENAMTYAIKNLNQKFDLKEESFFESSVISVNSENYKELLSELKTVLENFQSQLETDKGDRLVCFNVQIF